MNSFDRYNPFRLNGKIKMVPFINIRKKNTDKYIVFNKQTMRLDSISYEYYNNPDYAWLILQANPELGSIENFIPNGSVLRIPFPLDVTLDMYLNDINKHKEINE